MSDSRDFGYPQRSDGSLPGDLVDEEAYRRLVGFRGDGRRMAREKMFRVDDLMREAYDACRDGVAAQLSPVVVVQFDLSGGIWTLIESDGRRESVHLKPGDYQAVKSICHIPLGIYSILAPWLTSPHTREAAEPLRAFKAAIEDVLASLSHAELEPEHERACHHICAEAVVHIDVVLQSEQFDLGAFSAFTAEVLPSIKVLLPVAGRAQATEAISLLEGWRERLGDEWSELTGIVLAPYTLSVDNAAAQSLRHVMDPATVADRLLVLQGDFGNEVDPALEVAAHLYMDRLVARLVFGADTEENRTLTASLSSERDLVSDAAAEGVRSVATHEACPKVNVGDPS